MTRFVPGLMGKRRVRPFQHPRSWVSLPFCSMGKSPKTPRVEGGEKKTKQNDQTEMSEAEKSTSPRGNEAMGKGRGKKNHRESERFPKLNCSGTGRKNLPPKGCSPSRAAIPQKAEFPRYFQGLSAAPFPPFLLPPAPCLPPFRSQRVCS